MTKLFLIQHNLPILIFPNFLSVANLSLLLQASKWIIASQKSPRIVQSTSPLKQLRFHPSSTEINQNSSPFHANKQYYQFRSLLLQFTTSNTHENDNLCTDSRNPSGSLKWFQLTQKKKKKNNCTMPCQDYNSVPPA